MYKRLFPFLAFVLLAVLVTGCMPNNVIDIPAGYVARMLAPTGWQGDFREAGQIDIGIKNNDGTFNNLVLLEVTSTTVQEQFLPSGGSPGAAGAADTSDHRVLTQDGVPLSVDVFVRMIVPADKAIRESILVQVTPTHVEGDASTVKRVMVNDIYKRFAQPEVRSIIRSEFAKYKDYKDVYAHYSDVSDVIGQKIAAVFEKNKIPLDLQDVSLSNAKPDDSVLTAMNNNAAAANEAAAINTIGEALRKNPEYQNYMKWQQLVKIAEVGSKNGTNTIIITDSGGNSSTETGISATILQTMMDLMKQIELLMGKLPPPAATPTK